MSLYIYHLEVTNDMQKKEGKDNHIFLMCNAMNTSHEWRKVILDLKFNIRLD